MYNNCHVLVRIQYSIVLVQTVGSTHMQDAYALYKHRLRQYYDYIFIDLFKQGTKNNAFMYDRTK